VGSVEDFHFLSLREAVEPAVLQLSPGQSGGNILVKVAPGRSAAVVERLEALWKQVAPEQPFSFFFLDEAVQRQYEAEARWGLTVRIGAGLALLIACCGLFALAALTAEQRKREVGIRKIFGSTVAGLVSLLTREFVVLVLVALVLAVPPAYLAMERWLEGFTYRVDIGAGVFAAAGLAALVIALLTVGYQAIRTALLNPVDTLRYE
jgi:putative ABC transport system permease protein